MAYPQSASATLPVAKMFPEFVPVERSRAGLLPERGNSSVQKAPSAVEVRQLGQVRTAVLSFQNMHLFGDLLVNFLRARKRTFIDRLQWSLPETDGMEFDQYDTPLARWIVIYEFGEVLGGIRLTPTTARCGIYTYMLRDAQNGLLEDIPSDVLFFDAPVSKSVWEASRLFISNEVPSYRRLQIQTIIMAALSKTALDLGANQVIGIVPTVWSRWLRRMDLGAVPVGPKFSIDGTISQAALFSTSVHRN